MHNMVVPVPPAAGPGNAESVAPARWLVRSWMALFNSSSINSIANEIAQEASCWRASETQKHVAYNVAFLDNAHYEHAVESMLGMRDQIQRGAAVPKLESPNWTKGRLFWSWLAEVCGRQRLRARVPDELHLGRGGLLQPHVLNHPTALSGSRVSQLQLGRIAKIGNNLAKVLLGMHYSTLVTHELIRDHYDTAHYSGMSYLLFRGVHFTGCGVSLMQQKSPLYTLGTEVLCNPTSHNTHQVHTVNQYCDSVVIPETLESPGLYIPNLYMKDVRGGEVHVDGRGGPYDMVIAHGFNGFCPELDSASGCRRPYLFTTGHYQAIQGLGATVPKDPIMSAEAYTCMPTLLRPFSSPLRGS
ncbi:hypothetical protein Q5P01_016578 [Channa striata]|uniref:Uncharacterized protein n=1 Tax=Channa striata TaxID=64152 RepID=A0AA88M7U6_CHASR|nr:hypothetical protein Q5P01_016578 [Channa striata]